MAQLLKLLSECPQTVKNTKEFIKKIRKQKIPKDYTMVSFDVVSLFTNVPLEDRIKIILRTLYENLRNCNREICQLLYLCTKNVHFTFNNKIYILNDDVAMDSPLRPVLAELETAFIPSLSSKLSSWRSFVDDSICFVKKDSI